MAATSPHLSPAASFHEAPLDQLVAHFVAAKRSLSSTAHVYRANEIVRDARGHLEESALLRAKNTFLRRGVGEQVSVLHSVRGGLESVGAEVQVEFQAVIRSLDVANDRLQATLSSLRKTLVSPALSASFHEAARDDTDSPRESAVERSQKTLHDFIDESTHLDLLESLRGLIDSYNDSQAALHGTRTTLDDTFRTLDTSLHEIDKLHDAGLPGSSAFSDTPSANDEPVPKSDSLPIVFHALTDHATETASLLQSLISHYDLCITALKHTEGGGEAARAATFPLADKAPRADDTPVEESLYRDTIREPISDEERLEMLSVLENDSQEVDDVVLEIKERLAEMETQISQLSASAGTARKAHSRLKRVMDMMRKIGDEMPGHIGAAKRFRSTWATLQEHIMAKTQELVDLTAFYDNFLVSYASLLREAERRRMVEGKMRMIADRARKEIEALYHEDVDMREQFVKDVGEYLPRDIWPGLVDAPKRWVVQPVEEDPPQAKEAEVESQE